MLYEQRLQEQRAAYPREARQALGFQNPAQGASPKLEVGFA